MLDEEKKSTTYGLPLRKRLLFSWETDKATRIFMREHHGTKLVVA
jgi:hypothetical protein